eukprot:3861939-Pyramimonas_sp.AAC.1
MPLVCKGDVGKTEVPSDLVLAEWAQSLLLGNRSGTRDVNGFYATGEFVDRSIVATFNSMVGYFRCGDCGRWDLFKIESRSKVAIPVRLNMIADTKFRALESLKGVEARASDLPNEVQYVVAQAIVVAKGLLDNWLQDHIKDQME